MAFKKRIAQEKPTPRKRVRNEPPLDPSRRRVTRKMALDGARMAVFNTSELLERIIIYLPNIDIFAIQRVNQRFKDVIDTSPQIQTRLFLRLENKPRETWTKGPQSKEALRKVNDSDKRPDKHITPVTLNPLLEETELPSAFLHLYSPVKIMRIDTHADYVCVKIDFGAGHLGTHPSFLKTYITDPPCYRAVASLSAELQLDPEDPDMLDSGDSTVVGDIMENPKGLTLGDVIHGRTFVDLETPSLGQLAGEDISLAGMMAQTDCELVVEPESHPVCTLQLFNVCFPTEEERAAVSSEGSGASA